MINFFKLVHSVESKTIGAFPQVEEKWQGPTNYWAHNSYTKTPSKGRIEFDIVFPRFEQSKRGKLTDWVSSVNIGRNYLFCSVALLELVKGFILDEYQIFDVPVYSLGREWDYKLIFFPFPKQDEFINWETSTFYQTDDVGRFFQKTFDDANDYMFNKRPSDLTIRKVKIELYEDKITMDVFRFRGFDSGFFVSKRLKEAMESAGMTGILYEPAIWLPNQPSWEVPTQ